MTPLSPPRINTNLQIPQSLKEMLKGHKWGHTNLIDLHQLGVHYHDESFLPVWLNPLTYAAYARRGYTPPVSLPTFFPEDTNERIKSFLAQNYYKMTHGGIQYLGNEFNIQPGSDFEKKKVRVCICRLSPYVEIDGAFGHWLVNNFIQDFSDDIFVDFAFRPPDKDYPRLMEAGLPLWFGNSSKRPLQDFDFIIISNSFPQERLNVPFLMLKSGIPLYRWEREDKSLPYANRNPIITTAGLGAFFAENLFADHPTKGLAQSGMIDIGIIGEGEILDLKLFQHYINTVVEDKTHDRASFLDSLTNDNLPGIYDPRKILWEYQAKTHHQTNFKGEKIAEPQVYPQGGPIHRVSVLDYETQTKHVIMGPGSSEWEAIEPSNVEFLNKIKKMQNPVEFADPYKRKPKVIPIKAV